ncbi:hypothetical protein ARMGADRAFT_1004866 [Armillaria gallica]|uniref:MYND-type domain-containing protein n=1 Tax=Armillaria gallica TaxID=47427 RepID=A0A2H3EY35_ARMGA|nr:hypothetical protein ARMGADRAFT_1004866 [Armillaria gallica]
MNTTCLVCDTPTSTRCSGCKSVYYCSKAHIAQDWLTHKAYCKRVSAAGTNTFDTILFGVNETKPRLIKLPWSYAPRDIGDASWQKLDDKPWFDGKEHFIRTLYVQRFGCLNGPPLGRTLAVLYDDYTSINGSPINRCIQTVTRGNTVHPWAGNILALREQGMASELYNDAVMEEDLAPLIRYFEDYGKGQDAAR